MKPEYEGQVVERGARNAGGMSQGDEFGRMFAFIPLIDSSAPINGIPQQNLLLIFARYTYRTCYS
jgi:hypothetical protein